LHFPRFTCILAVQDSSLIAGNQNVITPQNSDGKKVSAQAALNILPAGAAVVSAQNDSPGANCVSALASAKVRA
jgi:hypothetical protein